MKLIFYFFIIFYSHLVVAGSFKIMGSELTCAEAKQVILIVLKHEGYQLSKKGMFLEECMTTKDGAPPIPGYYVFSLSYTSPDMGAIEYPGFYSVSALTGDVWENNLCKRYSFKELRHVQKEIMKKTGKSFADEKGNRKGLGCTDE